MGDIKNKQVNIYIDQSAAENALDKLQTKADGFNKKIDDCRKKQAALRDEITKTETAGNSTTKLEAQYKSLEKEITATTSKVQDNTASMKKLQEQIDSGLRPSFAQQEKLVTSLRNQLKQLSEDAPGYAAKFQAYQSATTELNRMRDAMSGVEKAQNSWLQEAKVVAFGVLIGNTVQQAIGAIGNYLSGIVTGNAKLSDTLADLQRVTGATKAEVKALYQDLKNTDTRTSTSGLLDIAIVAGKLGVAKDDIVSFTQAVDKLQVALGDELGDADQITEQLGKILNVFDGKVSGDNITHLGNAIVDLANKGIASGPFLVDFAQRVSGVAKASNLSLPAVLGLASGLEASGAKVESASTAVQKLLTTIATDLPKAAQIANVPLEQFQQLFADKPQEALLQYAAGLQKNKASFAEVAAGFKDAGEDGARTIAVLSTLGLKTDYFRQQMDAAGKAIQNTDEIQDAFNLKNQTLGAELDKLGKSFNALITSKTLSDFFATSISVLNKFIDALKAAPQWIKENTTGITLLVAGLLLMNETLIVSGAAIIKNTALEIINATATKLLAAETAIVSAAQSIYSTVLGVLTGNINLVTAATRIWTAVTTGSLGPIGAMLAVIGAVVIAVDSLFKKTVSLTNAQKLNSEVEKQVADSIGAQKKSIEDLLGVATNLNNTYEVRKAAIDQLIKINPDYLGGLDTENTASQRNIQTINEYINHLDALARAKALVDIKAEAYKKKLEQETTLPGLKNAADNQGFLSQLLQSPFGTGAQNDYLKALKENKQTTDQLITATETANQAVKDLNNQIDAQETVVKLIKEGKAVKDYTGNLITYAKAVKDLNELKQQRNLYQGLPEDTGLLQSPRDTAEINNKQQTLGEYKAFLQSKIDELKKNIDLLAKTDQKGRLDNLSQQKKYQEELDKLNGQTNTRTTKASDDARKKFQEFLKGLHDDFDKSNVPEDFQKIYEAAKKYFDDIKKLNDGRSKGFINAEDYKTALADIEKTYHNTVVSLTKEDPLKINVVPQVNEEDFDKVLAEAKEFLRRLTADNKAGLQLDVLNAKNPKEHRDAVIAELEFEKDQELSNTNLTANERTLIEEQYRAKEKQAWSDYYQDIISQFQEVINYVSQVVDIAQKFEQAKANRENAALNAELARNDKSKQKYQSLLNGKLLTQQEYNIRVAALDAAADKKKKELEKAQFERSKKLQIAQALTNGAMGVTAVLAARPGATDILSLGAFRALNIGITLATTAAEIATIASQKPQFGKGGRLDGPSHSDGGMPVINPITGQAEAEVEGGEVILSKSTVRNNKAAVDALLHASLYEGGRSIDPAYFSATYRPVSTGNIIRTYQTLKYASGGVLPGAQSGPSGADPALINTLQQSQAINVQLMQTVNALQEQLKKPIKGDWSLKQLNDAQDQRDRILQDATFSR